jgi:hypothetical protein
MERTGPDLRRVSGIRRNASKSRKRAARASLTSPGVSVAAARQPPIRIRARTSGSARAVSRGTGDLDEVQPAQQGDALPHGAEAIDHLKIAEQGLDAPPVRVGLNDGRGGQGGIGGQQQARPAAARLFQLAPRTMTPRRKRGRHTAWRSRADLPP